MKANLYYFSGTGNSLYIAKKLKAKMENEANKNKANNSQSDNSQSDNSKEDSNNHKQETIIHDIKIIPIQKLINQEVVEDQSDIVGIIYPTYFLDAPNVVKQFAKKLQLQESCYLFLYANYGETLGNALHNMNQIFTKHKVNGNFEVALPDNSIIFETKKEEIPKMLEHAEHTIKEQAKEIYAKAITEKSSYHFGYHMVAGIMKPLAKVGMGFYNMKVDQTSCNGCGMCEKICPMKNIHMEVNKTNSRSNSRTDSKIDSKLDSKSPVFDNKCESCFACMHLCPKEAIRYASMSKKKKNYQYRHPEVSIKEMMDANVL